MEQDRYKWTHVNGASQLRVTASSLRCFSLGCEARLSAKKWPLQPRAVLSSDIPGAVLQHLGNESECFFTAVDRYKKTNIEVVSASFRHCLHFMCQLFCFLLESTTCFTGSLFQSNVFLNSKCRLKKPEDLIWDIEQRSWERRGMSYSVRDTVIACPKEIINDVTHCLWLMWGQVLFCGGLSIRAKVNVIVIVLFYFTELNKFGMPE